MKLTELRALMENATPGPLQAMGDSPYGALGVDGSWFCETGCSDQDEDNAALIVALVNAAPKLLAVVEAAKAIHPACQGERLKDALKALEESPHIDK